MKKMKADVAMLGGGPGAYVAGPILADAGMKVICIEKEALGGICLKWGCMPTKSLASAAGAIRSIRKADKYGITVGEFNINFKSIMERSRDHTRFFEKNCENKFKTKGIELLMGRGYLSDSRHVYVEMNNGEKIEIEADYIIINTGSISAELPVCPFNTDGVMTNREILSLEKLPEKLLIIGGGVMGCEFADIFNSFGTKVMIIEKMDQLLSTIDKDVAAVIEDDFRKKGIDVRPGSYITDVRKEGAGFVCRLDSGEDITVDKILVVVGRKACCADIGLENTRIKTSERGSIIVNEFLQTDEPSVYALGDVIGGNLAHVSRMEGEILAGNILGDQKSMDYGVVPWAIFTNVEVAGVGLTEMEAKEQNLDFSVSVATFDSNGKAFVSDETEGFIKMITDKKSGKILGAEIAGAHASDLIHELALAVKYKISKEQIASMMHIHPSLAEGVQKAAR